MPDAILIIVTVQTVPGLKELVDLPDDGQRAQRNQCIRSTRLSSQFSSSVAFLVKTR